MPNICITLLTSAGTDPVMAQRISETSSETREVISPAWVVVKKRSDCFCTWRNNRLRRSDMMPWPIRMHRYSCPRPIRQATTGSSTIPRMYGSNGRADPRLWPAGTASSISRAPGAAAAGEADGDRRDCQTRQQPRSPVRGEDRPPPPNTGASRLQRCWCRKGRRCFDRHGRLGSIGRESTLVAT